MLRTFEFLSSADLSSAMMILEYRGALIPREYWKLIAYRAPDNALTSAAFVLSQNDTLSNIETLDFDPFRLFQVSLDELTKRTKLGFSAYASADVFTNYERNTQGVALESQIRGEYPTIREIVAVEQILF